MSNKPIDKIERFPVEASFFEGSNEDKSWVNTSISKVYKDDQENKWKRTNSFTGNDLLKLNAMMPDIIARQHELEHGQPAEQAATNGLDMDAIEAEAEELLSGESKDQTEGLSP